MLARYYAAAIVFVVVVVVVVVVVARARVCVYVCVVCVCPSHADIVSKRLNLGSRNQRQCTTGQRSDYFSEAKDLR